MIDGAIYKTQISNLTRIYNMFILILNDRCVCLQITNHYIPIINNRWRYFKTENINFLSTYLSFTKIERKNNCKSIEYK